MTFAANRVERRRYLDSVALMRVSRAAAALPEVVDAALMIGTPANKDLLRDAGLLCAEGEAATPNDLVIAVRARSEAAAGAALAQAFELLNQAPREPADAVPHARSLADALSKLGSAQLALISVPGGYAAREARGALEAGLHVLVFSDNVPIEDEVALKRLARERGLLLMGPDCGTALINGTPIAFANAVPRGAIGIVSASGTGLQEVSSLIARSGGGVSHGIGVGGHDLDARVGALGTLAAIDLLEADPATRHLVLISKPPAPAVAQRVLERLAQLATPSTVCFLGAPPGTDPAEGKVRRVPTLAQAAEAALARTGFAVSARRPALNEPPPRPGAQAVRGLFCGGTLCAEAQVVFLARGLAVASNAPVPGALERAPHRFLDLGADEFTRGRPHPMLEPDLRDAPLREALCDPQVAAVLIDLVIGYGAHPDPAGIVARVLADAPAQRAALIASVTGTEGDPQVYSRQVARLREAGALVAGSNAEAATLAAELALRAAA